MYLCIGIEFHIGFGIYFQRSTRPQLLRNVVTSHQLVLKKQDCADRRVSAAERPSEGGGCDYKDAQG
jgi:hypothetical protein